MHACLFAKMTNGQQADREEGQQADQGSPRHANELVYDHLYMYIYMMINVDGCYGTPQGYKKPLQPEDIFEVSDDDRVEVVSKQFRIHWAAEMQKPNGPSLVCSAVLTYLMDCLVVHLFH